MNYLAEVKCENGHVVYTGNLDNLKLIEDECALCEHGKVSSYRGIYYTGVKDQLNKVLVYQDESLKVILAKMDKYSGRIDMLGSLSLADIEKVLILAEYLLGS